MKVIVEKVDYLRFEDKLKDYYVKTVLNKVVLSCDKRCLEVLKELGIGYILDRGVFKLESLRVVGDTVSLDQLVALTGVSRYVEDYGYPAFHLLARPICVVDSGVNDKHEAITQNSVKVEKLAVSSIGAVDDDVGHGTAVASIISTLCPYSTIVSIKIFSSSKPEASIIDFLEALSLAVSSNCSVINYSLGGLLSDREVEMLDRDFRVVHELNSLAIAAVGNEGVPYAAYPARSKYAIGVGSLDRNLNKSTFSNVDIPKRKPEVTFIGEKINAANVVGYNVWSGTSFSTPVVSSLAYWFYYFYEYSTSYGVPVGYVLAVDGRKPWSAEGRRAVVEIAKRNRVLAVGEWDPFYGYGIPSFIKIEKKTFPSFFRRTYTYRRPKPARLAEATPFPIAIALPDIKKIVELITMPTEQTVYNISYTYVTQKYETYVIQQLVQRYEYAGGQVPYVNRVPVNFDLDVDGVATISKFPPLKYDGSTSFILRTVKLLEVKVVFSRIEGTLKLKVYGVELLPVEEKYEISEFDVTEVNKTYATVFTALPFDRIDVVLEGKGRASGVMFVIWW